MIAVIAVARPASAAVRVGGVELLGGEADAGRRGHRVPLAVVEHQDAAVGALEPGDRREDLLQDRREFQAVREPRARAWSRVMSASWTASSSRIAASSSLVPLALDRRGQDVGHGLEEVDVVAGERPRAAR